MIRSSSSLPATATATAAANSPAIAADVARDAESLFRTKTIAEIRGVEAAARRDIDSKSEELRQLVGRTYRDLIDSADSIILMRSSCESISSNLSRVSSSLSSLCSDGGGAQASALSPPPPDLGRRAGIYSVAARVKYLVDTPENIWGCLDESMLLEAAGRYIRARVVHGGLLADREEVLSRFPLLRHQWQIVESFKPQIPLRGRERLSDGSLPVHCYADALAGIAIIDELDPQKIFMAFLDSRRSWILQKIGSSSPDANSFASVICDVVRIIRDCLGQVGELFMFALNEMPMFYKTVLESPPGTQLFGGIPHPEEEVKLWRSHREQLESAMAPLQPEFIAEACSAWLQGCCDEIFGELPSGKRLIDVVESGETLASVEKLVREALDSRDGLSVSLEQWLKSVFGSEIESPWNQICGFILIDNGKSIWENRFEEAFLRRMKEILNYSFEELSREINIKDVLEGIVAGDAHGNDFQTYMKRSSKSSSAGGVWFLDPNHRKTGPLNSLKAAVEENDFWSCLNGYFGPEVSRIRDALDSRCGRVLEDLLCFMDSHNSSVRMKDLAPYLQDKCYNTISDKLKEVEDALNSLSISLGKSKDHNDFPPSSVIVERSLFVGRLLFALRKHSSHIPLILGSPRQWVREKSNAGFFNQQNSLLGQNKASFDLPLSLTPRRHTTDNPRSPRSQLIDASKKQAMAAAATLFAVDDVVSPKLDELSRTLQELCIKAHNLWILWVSDELSAILFKDLCKDESLSAATPLRGWEVTVVKQENSNEGPIEIKIALPSMPSLYVTSFLFQACLEIHKIGGHVLEKTTMQNFAQRLLGKVVSNYEDFLLHEHGNSQVSDNGILQMILDLRFCGDILSGGAHLSSTSSESNEKESSKSITAKVSLRRKQLQQPASSTVDAVAVLIRKLSQRLDPIDWATYEPYLWENEKQSYKRCAVLLGFFVQLNRMHTDSVQKLPTKSNTDSNILRCSVVPRYKYLPISAPALSSGGTHRSPHQASADDAASKGAQRTFSGEHLSKPDFVDTQGSGVAAPLLKSFMTQVGSRFGESTSRWGSMLSEGQVGRFNAMSTFGDMLPAPAAGLFSSLTASGRSESL